MQNYKRIFSGEWARYAWRELRDPYRRRAVRHTAQTRSKSCTNSRVLAERGQMLFRNATLKIYDRPTLRAVVQTVAEMDLSPPHDGHDLKGDMYEYLLSKLSQSGTNGQFRTPRHIIDLIVALVDPQPGMRICDPACGTAGFLIAAYRHILRTHTAPADLAQGVVDGSLLKPEQWEFLEEHAFTGFDNDANMVKIAILNLYLHQLERARIEHHNPLTTTHHGQYPGQLYDVILANPPFAGRVQRESILADLNLETRDTELLFFKWFLDHLAPNGRAGVIVPNGVLFGSGKADRRLRELLLTSYELAGGHQPARWRFQALFRRRDRHPHLCRMALGRTPSGSTSSLPTDFHSTTSALPSRTTTFRMSWPSGRCARSPPRAFPSPSTG